MKQGAIERCYSVELQIHWLQQMVLSLSGDLNVHFMLPAFITKLERSKHPSDRASSSLTCQRHASLNKQHDQ